MTQPHQIIHPYRDGYSVLPRLQKIGTDEIFQFDETLFRRAIQEKRLIDSSAQLVEVEAELDDRLRDRVIGFIADYYPVSIEQRSSLAEIGWQIREDIVIHALSEDRDWMAYGHVCFPSGWRPEEKIGRPLSEVHAPIPGMDLANSRKLIETMAFHGPFERFVWSVVFEDRLNFHPNVPKKAFDPNNPCIFVKVERQVTVPFPEQGGALFVLGQSFISSDEIERSALANAILKMSPEELDYKGLTPIKTSLVNHLRS